MAFELNLAWATIKHMRFLMFDGVSLSPIPAHHIVVYVIYVCVSRRCSITCALLVYYVVRHHRAEDDIHPWWTSSLLAGLPTRTIGAPSFLLWLTQSFVGKYTVCIFMRILTQPVLLIVYLHQEESGLCMLHILRYHNGERLKFKLSKVQILKSLILIVKLFHP